MNLDDAKENIQPLAGGRNIQRLETALSAESHEDAQAQLLEERRACEEAIRAYTGDDPLAPWYEYVLWVEQSCPRSGKESALDEVIQRCLVTFDSDERYRQDVRMVKLYIKYIDGQPNPTEHFHTLYSSGIGTRCADLYICWAYYHDLADAFDRAEEVFRRGRDAHAEPRDLLEQAHRQFGFSMSQRMLHKDTYRQEFISTMEERRSALTSLRSHRGIAGGGRATAASHQVGSVRTGAAAVKSLAPGRVEQSRKPVGAVKSNARIAVYEENASTPRTTGLPGDPPATATSVVQAIIDSSRRQENLREAGPWSKAGASKRPLYDSTKPQSVPQFPILVDVDMDCTQAPIDVSGADADLAIRLFTGHERRNLQQRPFPVAEFVECEVSANAFPAYDKCMLFPQPTKSYSIEELAAYRWFVRRGIRNAFVEAHEPVWGAECCAKVREYPQFQRRNEPTAEREWFVERYVEVDTVTAGVAKIVLPMHKIYPVTTVREERSMEELLRDLWQKGELPNAPEDEVIVDEEDVMGVDETMIGNAMDVTMAVKGRQSIFGGAMRKSIVPGGRKSIRPPSSSLDEKRRTMMAACEAIDEVEDMVEADEPAVVKCLPPMTVEQQRPLAPMVPSIFQKSMPPTAVEPSPAAKQPETITKPRIMFDTASAGSTAPEIPGPGRKSEFPIAVVPTTVVPSPVFAQPEPICKTSVRFDMASVGTAVSKITGPIRKSVVPALKPRTPISTVVIDSMPTATVAPEPEPESAEEHVDIVDLETDDAADADDVSGPTIDLPAPVTAPVPFAIFEDTVAEHQPPASTGPSDTDLFKQPLAPSDFLHGRWPLAARSRSPVHDDPGTVGDQTAYMPNETCSTQQFNFFIKAQSISTPKRLGAPRTPIELELSPTQEAVNKAPAMIVTTSAEQSPEYAAAGDVISPAIAPRQLSTIMETTEGTTLNSTSSDRDSDSGSHRNATAIAAAATSMLLHKRTLPPPSQLEAVSTPPQYGVTLASAAPADIASQCPIQVYEDRTDTVPLFNLVRPPVTTADITLQQLPSDLTLPALAANEIWQDPTEQMPMMPARVKSAPANVLAERLPVHEQPDVSLMPVAALPLPPQPLLADESLAALGNVSALVPNATIGNKLERIRTAQPTPIASICVEDDDMDFFLQLPKGKSDQPFGLAAVPAPTMQPLPLASVPSPPLKPDVPKLSDLSDFFLESPTPTQPKKSDQPFGLAAVPAPTMQPLPLASVPSPALKPDVPKLSDLSDFFLESPTPTQPKKQLLQSHLSQKPLFQEPSIHIKDEPIDHSSATSSTAAAVAAVAAAVDFSFILNTVDISDEPSEDLSAAVVAAAQARQRVSVSQQPTSLHAVASQLSAAPSTYEPEESIYVPRPIVQRRSVDTLADKANLAEASGADFMPPVVNMDATRQVIQSHLIDDNADPFDERVQQAFLDNCDFYDYLSNLPACQMQQHIRLLHVNQTVAIAGRQFLVEKLLGHGEFGQVYAAKCSRSGVTLALKQQRPASLWEYYICLEVESRIDVPHMVGAFMRIECALIGNNAGILVSECSRFGSLLAVCNRVKSVTGKNMSETVVMMLSMQLLAAVDHLHGCKIIHADIKPDNILLMRRLAYDTDEMCLQLIDFGQAIDLQLYPEGQTFRAQLSTKNFVCTEMLDGRQWLYQTDLFCAASTIHTLLFGTYMNVIKNGVLGYQITTNVPRYFCKWLWESLFRTLINVKDCRMMPNLQTLRVTLLEQVRGAREQTTRDAIGAFNRAIEE